MSALDIDTGQQRPIGFVPPYRDPAEGHDLSPDGSSVAIRYGAALSQKLSVRDVATGNELFPIDDIVEQVSWSPSGEYLAVASRGSVTIYDRSGNEVVDFPGGRGQFGPRGLIATFGEETSNIHVWNWRREEVIATLPASGVETVAFDPSGERIATDDLQIWDVASETLSLQLLYSPPNVNVTFAFSPDGTQLAVGSADEVRVFDAGSRAELQVLRHEGVVESDKVVFSPDGSMLASSAADGTRVWALDIDDLVGIARQNVTRSLSDEECRRYLHIAACSEA